MKNVLVTGYSGFVGMQLTAYLLNQGFDVTGIGRQQTDAAAFKQYTYPELAKIKGYNAIVHLAAKTHDLKKIYDEASYFKINTDLTKEIFNRFITSQATDFIYLSSVKAAADTVEGILTETILPDPLTAYGRSKLKAEDYLLNTELPAGKRIFILRPCMIHGPGNKGNLNLLYQLIKRRIPYPLAGFENKRSLLSIQNLLFVIAGLLNDPAIKSGIYNVADDEPLATTEIIDTLSKAMKQTAVQWSFNPKFIKKLALAGDKLNLPLNSERLQKLTESYVVSNAKIKQAIGITAMPVAARDGLLHTGQNL